MRLSGGSLRWLLPVLLVLASAAQMAAQISLPLPSTLAPTPPANIDELTKLAESGDSAKMLKLAHSYENGTGVAENYEEALKWLRRSADSGNVDAMLELGRKYDPSDITTKHNGITRDKDEAIRWYRMALERGNPKAAESIRTISGVMWREPKTVDRCSGIAQPNFSEPVSKHQPWFYPLCTIPNSQGNADCPDGFFYSPNPSFYKYDGCIVGLAQCPAGYKLVPILESEPHPKQFSYRCALATTFIASDRLALEPALMEEEGYACSTEPSANESSNEITARKASLDFCRANFLNDIKYKRLRLGLNGPTGVLVQLPNVRPFCTAAHCEMVLLKQSGRKYLEVLHQQSGHIDDYVVEKTSTNGYYDIEQMSKYEAAKKFVWDGSKYLAEQELEAQQQKGHAEQGNATSQARVATEQSVAKSQAAVVSALPDGDARAAARRQYASTLEGAMVRTLRNDQDVDPTLVSLRVYTTTPQTNDGSKTRDDFRLIVETNSIALPRDVVALLRKPMLNSDLYKLGFRELRFQDTVGDQTGSILCDVSLKPEGAHPAFCMKIEERFVPDNNKYNNDAGYWGYRASDWTPYHQWPKDYIVH